MVSILAQPFIRTAQILALAASSSCFILAMAFCSAGRALMVSNHFRAAGPMLYPASLRLPFKRELMAKNIMNFCQPPSEPPGSIDWTHIAEPGLVSPREELAGVLGQKVLDLRVSRATAGSRPELTWSRLF